jgi:hypothetical protein
LRDQVSHPYSTTGKITVLYILIKEYKRFNIIEFFYGKVLTPRPTPKLEDHILSAVRDCLIYSQLLSISRGLLHPEPEDTPCRVDRDTPNIEKKLSDLELIK